MKHRLVLTSIFRIFLWWCSYLVQLLMDNPVRLTSWISSESIRWPWKYVRPAGYLSSDSNLDALEDFYHTVWFILFLQCRINSFCSWSIWGLHINSKFHNFVPKKWISPWLSQGRIISLLIVTLIIEYFLEI